MKLGITMLIHNKDDIEFVTEFPCFLGHPVHHRRMKNTPILLRGINQRAHPPWLSIYDTSIGSMGIFRHQRVLSQGLIPEFAPGFAYPCASSFSSCLPSTSRTCSTVLQYITFVCTGLPTINENLETNVEKLFSLFLKF